MQVELTKDDLALILEALEYYRSDIHEFGIRHGETPSEIAKAEQELESTATLSKKLVLYSTVGQPT